MLYEETIQIPLNEDVMYEEILCMDGWEVNAKYGLQLDDMITKTADFGNGYEMAVNIVISYENDNPYSEAVLFQNGKEVACTEGRNYEFAGKWSLEYNGDTFVVNIGVL